MVLEYTEFEELMDELTHRFSKANIDGTLQNLLDKIGWSDVRLSMM